MFDQPNEESFCNKVESGQLKAVLAIAGVIQGTF